MRIATHLLLMIAGAGIGLAVGLALRPKPASVRMESAAEIQATPANPPAKLSPILSRRAAARARDDSPLATELERNLWRSGGVTRWLHWMEAVERAAPGDFPRLARLAQSNPAALRFVAARWVEIAPRHLFDTLAAASKSGGVSASTELATMLIEEWARRDPEALIAAVNESEDVGKRFFWRMSVVEAVLEKDLERGLRLMGEWHIENWIPDMRPVAKWAASNPRHAADFALKHPAGFYATREVMEIIGKEWGKTAPASALEFAAGHPGEFGSILATSALKEWAERDPGEAAHWLAKADARTANRLTPAFVEAWAKRDAASAFSWCEENLTGSRLAQATRGVLAGAAAKDIAGAAAMVAAMNPSPARTEAAIAVAEKWFAEVHSSKAVAPEAIAWLTGLDANSAWRVLKNITLQWATSEPRSMAAFLATSDNEHFPPRAYTEVARELARKNPAEALEWASRLPDSHALPAGGEAFRQWWIAQPNAALDWLNEVPASDARRQSYFRTAIESLAYDSQAAERLATMTPAQRAAARNVIEKSALPEDPRARLLDALRPPQP